MLGVIIAFEAGPQQGETRDVELGSLVVGREPITESHQQALALIGAGQSVSRTHFELFYQLGEVRLRSISANGTKVNGKAVTGEMILVPGDTVSPSEDIRLRISWRAPEKIQASAAKSVQADASSGLFSSGPLASPVIRSVIAIYLLGILGVAAWLNLSNSGSNFNEESSAELTSAYRVWGGEQFSVEELESRIRIIEGDLETLRVAMVRNEKETARVVCRRLRAMDATRESPVYRYAATCLAQL